MSFFLLPSLVPGMLAMMIRTSGTGQHMVVPTTIYIHKSLGLYLWGRESLTPREYFEVKHFNIWTQRRPNFRKWMGTGCHCFYGIWKSLYLIWTLVLWMTIITLYPFIIIIIRRPRMMSFKVYPFSNNIITLNIIVISCVRRRFWHWY